jgi:hypothetical protein
MRPSDVVAALTLAGPVLWVGALAVAPEPYGPPDSEPPVELPHPAAISAATKAKAAAPKSVMLRFMRECLSVKSDRW